jgi:hypothetical protein
MNPANIRASSLADCDRRVVLGLGQVPVRWAMNKRARTSADDFERQSQTDCDRASCPTDGD